MAAGHQEEGRHPGRLRIAAVGDVSLGDHYFSLGHGIRAAVRHSGLKHLLADVGNVLASCDAVFGNLEVPLTVTSTLRGRYRRESFRGDPSFADELAACGFKALSVANNHSMQHGKTGFLDTCAALESAGVLPVGVRNDGGGSVLVTTTLCGRKVGWLGYSGVPDDNWTSGKCYALFDAVTAIRDVRAARESTDLVVVSLHAGTEAKPNADPVISDWSRQLVGAGASAVLCHHSHVFHGAELVSGAVVAYGLGDFLFDLPWSQALSTAAVVVAEFPAGDTLPTVNLHPFEIAANWRLQLLQDQRVLRDRALRVEGQRQLQWRKLGYFARNLHRGDTMAKVEFALHKAASVFVSNPHGPPHRGAVR